MFASPDKAQEVGNRDYCANRDTRYYMSKLIPEQFKEVKPFLETSVSYHAVSREGKVDLQSIRRTLLLFIEHWRTLSVRSVCSEIWLTSV